MNQSLILSQKGRKNGSYYREDLAGDVIYNGFYHREFQINFAKKGRKKTTVSDGIASFLCAKGQISQEALSHYLEHLSSLFTLETLSCFDRFSVEALYRFLWEEREKVLGKGISRKAFLAAAEESQPLVFQGARDQRDRIGSLCKEKSTVLVSLTEGELFATAKEVLVPLHKEGKRIVFIVGDPFDETLPSKEDLSTLLPQEARLFATVKEGMLFCENISLSDTALLVFGESGLLDCRNLLIPSGVFALPRGYFACAVAGQLGLCEPCAFYIPKGFSIIESVPITSPSRASYLIFSKLAKCFGDGVYSFSLEEVYGRYPNHFFNVYETSHEFSSSEVIPAFHPESKERREFSEFDALREKAIREHLESFPNCEYYSRLFTEKDTEGIRGKILVHGAKVKFTDARVIPCGKGLPLRKKIRETDYKGTALSSNFLFFLTPKLATLFNTLRHDRKEEQAQVDAGHLDYLLEHRDGVRTETFPLFRKTCIAMKENGEFIFFNFRLGKGSVRLNGIPLSWEKEGVDPDENATLPPVCIYTPYLSSADKGADRETYRKAVGEGRFNLVVIQNRITAIREGNVLLPGMGVVISLDGKTGEALCKKLAPKKLENGYFSPEGISLEVKLDAPEGIEKEEWEKVKWAYGGGLSLILDGVGLCDGDRMEEWFDRDGWTSPLSCQTQESTLHTLVKHPRTAIGTTFDGSLVVLVFSGRTSRSDGADYSEMCTIARKLVPDIQNLMNVDGGGSAMLGMVYNGSFTELSLPSTSTGSTVGMVRPINTTLFIPLEERK